jgi:MFS family permease
MMEASAAWSWLGGLSALCAALSVGNNVSSASSLLSTTDKLGKNVAGVSSSSKRGASKVGLAALHTEWLALHFVVKLADWLQGTNMYTLYKSYGVDPGLLFMTGFATSAVFSTFLGHWVDKYGRKRGCVVYCLLEVVIQVLEHSSDVRLLLVGRVLGGASTALLFSAFESWLVSAHKQRRLSEESLVRCFSAASTLNGLSAVLAGLIARVAFTWGGEIAPFQVSLVLTVVALFWISLRWEENWGEHHEQPAEEAKGGRSPRTRGAKAAAAASASTGAAPAPAAPGGSGAAPSWWELVAQPEICACALVQAVFEGAMYTFVFMWVQTFLTLAPGEQRPPVEVLFSCLMVALTIGGVIFEYFAESIKERRPERIGAMVFLAAAVSMAAAAFAVHGRGQGGFAGDQWGLSRVTVIMVAFCLFEVCVGMFDPWMSTMRSLYVPERVMATVMTLARVPLNLLVGLGVHLTENYDLPVVFSVCAAMHIVCAATCFVALRAAKQRAAKLD